ncbi:hypothetical protein [Actinokineospora bangkokensis]|uniref:hypothetical protein n=1 Tax=Actinokineospora bangkokensis TaxID=1193682 RepID=UPI000AE5D7AC|nr:hypothetical protein [Actinokineospora bangkokensis]
MAEFGEDEVRSAFERAQQDYLPTGRTTAESVIARGARVRARRRAVAVAGSAAAVVGVLVGGVLLLRPPDPGTVPPGEPVITSVTTPATAPASTTAPSVVLPTPALPGPPAAPPVPRSADPPRGALEPSASPRTR